MEYQLQIRPPVMSYTGHGITSLLLQRTPLGSKCWVFADRTVSLCLRIHSYVHDSELEGTRDPHLAMHGSFSCMVSISSRKILVYDLAARRGFVMLLLGTNLTFARRFVVLAGELSSISYSLEH